ncbi:MAG: polyphosphate:AMP phosphotransferase [Lachnospiraceae bacterium]|nr:polyphosphate:AMP phosphotransferase [Lachnospiraceae bacterium]
MLEKVDLKQKMSKEDFRKKGEALKAQLTTLDGPIKTAGLPVIILFEGWEGAGKGSIISRLIKNFDPRWFTMVNTLPPTPEEMREPMMWRHWKTIPEAGSMAIYDRSWYQEVSTLRIQQKVDDLTNIRHMNEINNFERGLADNGYVIIKFFLHISKKEQRARMDALKKDKDTKWRVSEADEKTNKEYDTYYNAYEQMLEYTNTVYAPWHVISGMDERACAYEVFDVVADTIQKALKVKKDREEAAKHEASLINPGQYHFLPMPKLAEIKLDKTMSEETYRKQLKKEQKRLAQLHNRIYKEKIPVIIAYEGWDAAGKGGNIKRVSEALDPRGYEVLPIASPSKEEKNRHFLWRFWTRLPKDGHFAIFDRTWYGRVMVERIEGFCTTADWQRAYGEINDFERQLYDWGAIILKFWIHIDSEEQLRRFTDRQNTPAKQWKITDEDWRNREKWPQYEEAVDDMLKYTTTDFAPWHVILGNDKKYARIQTLKIINDTIEERLNSARKRKR